MVSLMQVSVKEVFMNVASEKNEIKFEMINTYQRGSLNLAEIYSLLYKGYYLPQIRYHVGKNLEVSRSSGFDLTKAFQR